MRGESSWGRGRLSAQLSLALFGAILPSLLLTWRGWSGGADAEIILGVARRLVYSGTLAPDTRNTKPPPHGLGQSLVFTPVVLGIRLLHPTATPARRVFLERELCSLVNPVLTAALGALFFLLSVNLGAAVDRAAMLAVLLVFGTPFWSLSQTALGEPASALAWFAAVATTVVARTTPGSLVLGGALAGFGFLTRPSTGVMLPAIAVGLAIRRPPHQAHNMKSWQRVILDYMYMSIGAAPFVALHLYYDFVRYNRPLVVGYPGRDQFFTTPLLVGLGGLLWSPLAGLLWYAPIGALAVLCVPVLLRRRLHLGLVAAIAFTLQLLLHAKWDIWWGGGTWGPRFLMPALPIVFLALLPAVEFSRVVSAVVCVVGIVSGAINALGAARPLYYAIVELHDIGGTNRLLMQLTLLRPSDLDDFPSMKSFNGTFWPVFRPSGIILLCCACCSMLVFLRFAKRYPPEGPEGGGGGTALNLSRRGSGSV